MPRVSRKIKKRRKKLEGYATQISYMQGLIRVYSNTIKAELLTHIEKETKHAEKN